MLQITLDQWRALLAIVDEGGYAAAAEALNKSQSAVSYAINKLEGSLGVRVFALAGRKAVLTPAGEMLYRRAQALVEEASALEKSAAYLSARCEAEITLAVEVIFPQWLLLEALDELGRLFPDTRVEVYETVLTGTVDAVLNKKVDLAITSLVPPGFMGTQLLRSHFLLVAAPHHPLHRLAQTREVSVEDLKQYRQLVVRDSGSERKASKGWLGAEKRWTFSHMGTSIYACVKGYGFAWYPSEKIDQELEGGGLQPLPLADSPERYGDLHLVLTEGDYSGPVTLQLASLLQRKVAAATGKANALSHPK